MQVEAFGVAEDGYLNVVNCSTGEELAPAAADVWKEKPQKKSVCFVLFGASRGPSEPFLCVNIQQQLNRKLRQTGSPADFMHIDAGGVLLVMALVKSS